MADAAWQVRIAPVLPADASHATAPHWLGAAERERWASLANAGRAAFVASRRLLREALADATGRPAEGWQVSCAAGSAPRASRIDGDLEDAPALSLAHRLGWVAVAAGAAPAGRIGVDLECERASATDPAARAALFMADDELRRWQALPAAQAQAALLRAWVVREAWFKAAAGDGPWNFRRLACEPCDAALADVRVWQAGALHVALCVPQPGAVAAATCSGWPDAAAVRSSTWRVTARPAS